MILNNSHQPWYYLQPSAKKFLDKNAINWIVSAKTAN